MNREDMSRKDIEEWIEKIRQAEGDDESQHASEDGLHQAVLGAIAEGTLRGISHRDAATLALSTLDMDFARWCA